MDKILLGKKIRQRRKEKGYSQEELSEKIDISPRHMCTIENGNSVPSIETFLKIARVLEIDVNKFFNVNSYKNKNNARNIEIRNEIIDLIYASTISQLSLIKDLIIAVQKQDN